MAYKNKEAIRACKSKYYQHHKEAFKARSIKYNQDHKEAIRVSRKKRYNNNPNTIKNLLKRFNLTSDEYNQMLEKQYHRCAICGTHEPEVSLTLAVYHDHITGKVTGLLCGNCNTGICSMCGEKKPPEDFQINKCQCKACIRVIHRLIYIPKVHRKPKVPKAPYFKKAKHLLNHIPKEPRKPKQPKAPREPRKPREPFFKAPIVLSSKIDDGYRTCVKCLLPLPISEFGPKRATCKKCDGQMQHYLKESFIMNAY